MIVRHRTPQGDNLDRDLGPGPVGRPLRAMHAAIGAVLLTDAIPHADLSKPWRTAQANRERQPVDRSASVKAYWASLTPEQRKAHAAGRVE